MKIIRLKCLHCSHKWIPRIDRKPKTCPKCKSYNWEKLPQVKHKKK